MLNRLFKRIGTPQLQDPDPARRSRALARLDPIAQQDLLLEVARTDPVIDVRQAAVACLTDANELLGLMEDPELTACARRRITNLIQEGLDPLALAATISDLARQRHLLDAVTEPDHWQPLLERFRGDDLLANVASHHPLTGVRQAAAERLVTESALRQVEKASRDRDKVVARQMRERLERLRRARHTLAELDTQLANLLTDLRRLSREDPQRAERLAWLRGQRDELSAQREALTDTFAAFDESIPAVPDTHHEFDQRADELQAELDAEAAAAAEREAQAVAEASARAEQEAVVASMERLLAQLGERMADHPAPASEHSAVRAALELERARWQDITATTAPSAELTRRQQRAEATLDALLDALLRLESLPSADAIDAEEATDTQEASIEAALQTLAWPAELATPPPVRKLEERLQALRARRQATRGQRRKLTERIRKSCARLDRMIDAGNLRAARGIRGELEAQLAALGEDHDSRIRQQVSRVTERMDELADWQRYATLPKREALCAEMEALAADTELAPEPRAARVKRLREQWNGLGPARDEAGLALVERFNAAAEAAFAPSRSHFEAKAELQRFNTENRKRICDELDAFLADYDWEAADWRAVEKIYQRARQEWKRYADTDARGRSLGRRYHALIRRLRERLEARWKENIARKEALVSAAEKLAEGGPDPANAAAARRLQADWKAIDITPRSADRPLWTAFRAACDRIFTDLETHAQDEQAALADDLKTLQGCIDEMRAGLAELRAQPLRGWEGFDALPADRLRALLERLAEARTGGAMAKRLKQASSDARGCLAQFRELRSERIRAERLLQAEAALTSQEVAMAEDLPAAWKAAAERRESTAADDTARRAACIDLELALGSESPAEDAPLRLQRQVVRLETGLRGAEPDQQDPLDRAVTTLLATPAASAAGEALTERARAAISAALDAPP